MSGPDGKRRLPLAPRVEVKEPEDEDRPPWHWSGIGAVGVFVFWMPLAMLVNGVLGVRTGVAAMLLNAAAFALACFGAGLVVGRFGGQAGRREAMVSGLVAAAIAWLVTSAPSLRGDGRVVLTLGIVLAVLAAIGAGAAWVGGAIGVARRPR
jgi:tRNA-(ms[2]io[6]A)-hydroxylase